MSHFTAAAKTPIDPKGSKIPISVIVLCVCATDDDDGDEFRSWPGMNEVRKSAASRVGVARSRVFVSSRHSRTPVETPSRSRKACSF